MIKSFSKINLSLRVLGIRKDGLHNIQSNNVVLDVHDKIKISKSKINKDEIIFKGESSKYINKKKNSITETLKILREIKLLKSNYKIIINKKIPVFSGLGGGTSNSAFLLKFFLKNTINESILNKVEKKIGSDLRIFLKKQSFQKNLFKLYKYKKNFKLYLVLASPNVKCSTKNIYSKVKKFSSPSKTNFSIIKEKSKFIEKISIEKNDLERIAIKKFHIISKYRMGVTFQE
jgi:4-diphosphocytidyl-2-C-methyl-D-erythritol kinase